MGKCVLAVWVFYVACVLDSSCLFSFWVSGCWTGALRRGCVLLSVCFVVLVMFCKKSMLGEISEYIYM